MRKTACLQYQEESERKAISSYGRYFFASKATIACERSNCWDCEQGIRIKEEVLGVSTEKQCIIEGCTKTKLKARGMCKKHYDRWWYKKEKASHGGKKLSERGVDGRKGTTPSQTIKECNIQLNFTEYPELLERLHAQARDEFRPLDMQIMYLLKKGF